MNTLSLVYRPYCTTNQYILISLCSASKDDSFSNDDHLRMVKVELPSPTMIGLSLMKLRKAVSELSFIVPNDKDNWIPVRYSFVSALTLLLT